MGRPTAVGPADQRHGRTGRTSACPPPPDIVRIYICGIDNFIAAQHISSLRAGAATVSSQPSSAVPGADHPLYGISVGAELSHTSAHALLVAAPPRAVTPARP